MIITTTGTLNPGALAKRRGAIAQEYLFSKP
jgi:hypothetical protein